MGLRFRRSVKVFPGVRLNISSRGISTTVGVRGASVNFGPRGTYLNLGIPGTHIGVRQRVDRPAPPAALPAPGSPLQPPLAFPPPSPIFEEPLPGEIASGTSDEITSDGLRAFRDLIVEAGSEANRLRAELPAIRAQADTQRSRRDAWERGFLFKRLFPARLEARVAEAKEAERELEELEGQIAACALPLKVDLPNEHRSAFATLTQAFDALAQCRCCWDTTSEVAIDRVRERSWASSAVTRRLVRLGRTAPPLVRFDGPVLFFPNANGGDLFILPGFLMVFRNLHDFALIELREVTITCLPVKFVEDMRVPEDTRVVGQTWQYVNKGGGPDRRFSYNPQRPIVQYATLEFFSSAGLNEQYMFSHPDAAERFERAFRAYQATSAHAGT